MAVWLIACPARTLAQDRPGITVTTALSISHDDNVYRLPHDVPTTTVGADAGSRADTSVTPRVALEALGLLGRQRFSVSLAEALQRNAENQSNDGATTDWSARWQAAYPGAVSSDLSLAQTQAQSDYADVRSDRRNDQTVMSRGVGLAWQPRPDRRLAVNYNNVRGRNSLAQLQFNDYDSETWRIELATDSDLGKTLGVGVYLTRSEYPNPVRTAIRTPFGPIFFVRDNSFVLHGADMFFVAPVGATAALQGRVGLVSRKGRSSTDRDFRGVNGSVTASWAVAGHTTLAASWIRDTNSAGDLFRSASRSTTSNLGLNYALTRKATLAFNAGRSRIRYGASPAESAGTQVDEVSRVRAANLGWSVRENFTVNASVSRVSRDANEIQSSSRATLTQVTTQYRMRGSW